MLKLKYLFENNELAKECLKFYFYDEDSVDEMLKWFRISSNAVYPFCTEDKSNVCFLRLSPVEEKNHVDVESEIRFIDWLCINGYPAMKPYPMKDGRLSSIINTEWGTYNVSCFEAVPGENLEDTEGNLDLSFGYGKALGELHLLSEKYPYAKERRSYEELLAEIEDRLERYQAPETVKSHFRKVSNRLNSLVKDDKTFGLIHYDFEPDNVLFEEKSSKFGVIDFDDAIRCWYALDVVRALDAMDDVVSEKMVEEAVCSFMKGYRSIKNFSDDQWYTMSLMRELVHLQEYSTILYVLSESVDD
ncbi:phosphotransferase enzyme family protein [Clostridium sp. HCS.1]|uniref:phosphotransferase enzyme family protein n=1 Tax=Clostridium sp. HCS.1 TaxID=3238594 RepID=UPI003A0FFA33